MASEQETAIEQATEKVTAETPPIEKPKKNKDNTTIAITKKVRDDLFRIKWANKDKSFNATLTKLIKMHDNGGKNKASPVPETETLNPATAE